MQVYNKFEFISWRKSSIEKGIECWFVSDYDLYDRNMMGLNGIVILCFDVFCLNN